MIIGWSSDLATGISVTVRGLVSPSLAFRPILMRKMNRAAVQANDISGRSFERDIRIVAVITTAMLLPRFGPVFMKRVMMAAGNNPHAAIFWCT